MGEEVAGVYSKMYCPQDGGICWMHEQVCEQLEQKLKPRALTPEMMEAKKKEREERMNRLWDFQMMKNRMYDNGDFELDEQELDDEKRALLFDVEEETEEDKEERKRRDERMEELFKEIPKLYLELKHKRRVVEWTIEEGETYDVLHLLTSPSRNFLVKNNGDQVHIGQLSGKYVLLYFAYLRRDGIKIRDPDSNIYVDLEEIYNAYHPKGVFEVVFVAIGNDQDLFNDSFSTMPWLAIPHEDQETRDFFKSKFAIPDWTYTTPVLFDPNGTVLLKDAKPEFRSYGVEGFPFTKRRMMDVYKEARRLWCRMVHKKQKLPLTALLGDTLISSNGNQECTSKLEGKTVGLFFFVPGWFEMARLILDTWNLLKDKHQNFEIVLINEISVNHRFSKEAFKNEFGCIPWYSLPTDGRKLCHIFKLGGIILDETLPNAGYFIVLQADKYQPLSYFAYDILEEFGVDSYPFTLEAAVRTVMIQQQKTLALSKLLSPSAPLFRGTSTSYKEDTTTVSHLSGKRVLLLFATHLCYEAGLFFPRLKRMYNKKRGTSGEFEVIYISFDCIEESSSFLKSVQEMPWLFYSYDPNFAASLYHKLFQYRAQLPAIAAFGADGHLKTMASNLLCKDKLKSQFPFISADMTQEVHNAVVNKYKWDLDRLLQDVTCFHYF